jgi:putative transcriptional regulator
MIADAVPADVVPGYTPGSSPAPADVFAARKAAGLTQTEAAASVYLGGYYRWSEYESGRERMDPARFELFLVKHGLHPLYNTRRTRREG